MKQVSEIYGDTVYKLTPEIEFAVLCLHHYKDMNSIYLLSKGSLKLSLFCDIYYYIKNGSLDIAKLHSICSQLGIIEFVYYCLYYTDLVFKDCVLYPYLSALHTEKTEGILNTFGLAGDEIKEWGIDFAERLFGSIRSYFNSHLSQNEFDKINLNNTMM